MKGLPQIKILALIAMFAAGGAQAMPIKSQILKSRAYFQEAENNLLEALDLKAKTLTFGKIEFDQCGANLVRRAQTLAFSCTLPIPTGARVSKLKNVLSAKSREISFGGTKRTVLTQVSEDARSITFSTAFDATGIDFEMSKFNDDFFAVYAKVAQTVIGDALKASPVRLEVLESH